MKKLFLPGLLSTIILLAACKKDNTTGSTSIDGTYNFKYMSVKGSSSVMSSSGDKVITISDYSTINNAGTVTFNNGILTAQGVTYSVDSQSKTYEYDEADLLDSLSLPFSFTIPAINSAGQYKVVGSDSIYFPQGGMAISGSGSYQSLDASGGHYSFNGNLLTITQSFIKDSSFTELGETYHQIETATSSIVFEK